MMVQALLWVVVLLSYEQERKTASNTPNKLYHLISRKRTCFQINQIAIELEIYISFVEVRSIASFESDTLHRT